MAMTDTEFVAAFETGELLSEFRHSDLSRPLTKKECPFPRRAFIDLIQASP
jgi:hypothetical protein